MYTEARVSLVCTYDSDVDAAYIYLEHPIPPGAVRRVVPFDISDTMAAVDLDVDGRILGLEIIGAQRCLPGSLLDTLSPPDPEPPEDS